MAIPKSIATEFIEKIREVLEEKRVEFGIKEILGYEPISVYTYPTVAINWLNAVPIRTDRKYMRITMVAEIFLYYGDANANKRKKELDDLIWAIGMWLLKNQTLKGYSIMCDLQSVMTLMMDAEQLMIGGRIELAAEIDKVDIEDVTFGG